MTTALELSRQGWKRKYRPRRKRKTEIQQMENLRKEILRRLIPVAQILKERFGAKKVIIFGALAHGAWFTPDSDIDIAVVDLSEADYWKAWRFVEEALDDYVVDFLDWESLSPEMQQDLLRYGQEL